MSDDEVEFVRETKKQKTVFQLSSDEDSDLEEEFEDSDESTESTIESTETRDEIFADPKYITKFDAFAKKIVGKWKIYNSTEKKSGKLTFTIVKPGHISVEFNIGYEGICV
jgi:hypothetical protein